LKGDTLNWNKVPHSVENIQMPHLQYLAVMNTLKQIVTIAYNYLHTVSIKEVKKM
jgi:hypothetical protein